MAMVDPNYKNILLLSKLLLKAVFNRDFNMNHFFNVISQLSAKLFLTAQ